MQIKAVIFDLDGVIVSTDSCHYMAWKKIADEEKIYFDETINNLLRGVSRMESLEIILQKADKAYSDDDKMRLAERKNAYYKEYIQELTSEAILPGVIANLKELKENGILIGIGSSSKNTPLILKQIGLDNYFDAVSDGNNITNSKPDPEVFLKAATMLNVKPQLCAIVEDANAGIIAGKKAGMLTIGVNGISDGDITLSDLNESIYAAIQKSERG